MSQLALPLDDTTVQPTPSGEGMRRDAREVTEDDVQSSEERRVELVSLAGTNGYVVPAIPTETNQNAARRAPFVRAWPAALTWADALDYTSCSASQLRRWEKAGALHFRRVGRNGSRVVMRSELDRLLEAAFAPGARDITEDFDFG